MSYFIKYEDSIMLHSYVYELIKNFIVGPSAEDIWKWRKAATGKGILRKYYLYRYLYALNKLNSYIPIGVVFNEQPCFPHNIRGVFISNGARIGKGCTILHQVTIGSNTLNDSKGKGAPSIGDNVYIGCGAKIIGNVIIGNNVRIGANCVVVKDVEANSTVVLTGIKSIKHEYERNNQFTEFKHGV